MRSPDNKGANDAGLTVFHISWAYEDLAPKSADNGGLTVLPESN